MDQKITAEEVARRFRIWRVNHRSMTSVAELEKETQIPAKRLQKLLLHKDALREYTEHIVRFLEAFDRKDHAVLQQLRGDGPTTLPPAHTMHTYSTDVLSAIKARQRGVTRHADRPHCIIVKQEISTRQCVATQNSRDCYGCGASTRFCAECGYDIIAFPGAELCNFCLTKSLEDKEVDKADDAGVIHVECPISGGKRITVTSCHRMQSDACTGCNAITRRCSNCKERRVRYSDFGLCLSCHVILFNPLWQPLDVETLAEQQAKRDAFFSSVKPATAKAPEPRVTEPSAPTVTEEVEPQKQLEPEVLQIDVPEEISESMSPAMSPVPVQRQVRCRFIRRRKEKKVQGVEPVPQPIQNLPDQRPLLIRAIEFMIQRRKVTTLGLYYHLEVHDWFYYDVCCLLSDLSICDPWGRTESTRSVEELKTLYYYCYPEFPEGGLDVIYQRRLAELMLSHKDTTTRFVWSHMRQTPRSRQAIKELERKGIIGPASVGRRRREILVSSIDEIDEKLGIRPLESSARLRFQIYQLRNFIERTLKANRVRIGKDLPQDTLDQVFLVQGMLPELEAFLTDKEVLGSTGWVLIRFIESIVNKMDASLSDDDSPAGEEGG